MNANIEHTIKMLYMSQFQQMQPKDRIIQHEILGIPWEVIGADKFSLYIKDFYCIVGYHSNFPVIKKTKSLSADSLILECKVTFQSMGYPRKDVRCQ